jgi:uroporphyrinogen III methyltransferase/synthase
VGIGKVYIVGGGPGAADLITVRGLRALRRADLIVCDRLLPEEFLDGLGLPAEGQEVVRREAGDSQQELNELVADAALRGRCVARLKGGDPFVFGRGEEELAALSARGIPWEAVPGLSSAVAAPALAGLPLTRRGTGRSFAVATARTRGGGELEAFPRADTLVVLMGVAVLEGVVARLLADGWPAEEPAAVIERAAQPWERRAHGELAGIAEAAVAAHVGPPAVLVVGEGARSDGATQRPRVLFTGLDPTNFRHLGDLLHWPALRVAPDPDGARALPAAAARLAEGAFSRIVFTSKVGVASFFEALAGRGMDARALAGARIVAAGAGTALRLRAFGIGADAVPTAAGARGILEVLGDVAGREVLLVQGTHAPGGLEREIVRRGGRVTRLALHKVEPHPGLGRPLPEHEVAYFVSPSGVRAYCGAYGPEAFRRDVWCIGEVTLTEVRKFGFNGKVVDPHDVSQHTHAPAAAH